MRTIEIKCRFCDKINGSFDIPDDVVATYEELVEDARCDEHEAKFGNYKDMEEAYLAAGGSIENFKADIAEADYKIQNFQAFIEVQQKRTDLQKSTTEVELTGSVVDAEGNVHRNGVKVGNINEADCEGCQ